MERTIRVLRVAVPIALVGFVIVLALSWTRGQRGRDNADAGPVTSTQRPKDAPIVEGISFEDTQTIGGRVVSRIRAERVVAFVSGWNTLENVQITIYRESGLTYELVCPQAQFNSDTKEADAKGGVQVKSSDGVEIKTAEIHFDGNRLTNRIPVEFKIDRWQGNAGALDLDVQGETLKLFQTMSATLVPATPAEAPMHITSSDATFRRRDNEVTFQDSVVMTRAADRLTAARVLGRFTKDRKSIVGLEGMGNVVIAMSSNTLPGEDLGGRKEITCDRFHSELSPAGAISAINAVGDSRPARAILDGPPKRDIVAKSFRIGLAGRAVSDIRADGDVVMTEFAEVTREVRSDQATVAFDAAQHRAISAVMEGNFRYTDPKTKAVAIRAHYDIPGDRLLLTAQPGFDPSVTTDGQTVKARQIEFAPRAGTAKATGEVIAELISKQGGPSADGTNIFPAGRPVFVNADVLTMQQSTKTATFSGNVRAWQELNTLFAGELQVQGTGQVITARTNVRTALYNAGAEVRKIPVRSQSDQLIARRNERKIDLLGSVKLEDESRTITSEKATIFFDAGRKIEKLEAAEKVILVEKTASRTGNGDKVVYLVKQKMAYMTGSPATAVDPQGSVSGQQIVFDLSRNRVQIVSPSGQTQGTFKQQ